MGEVHTTSAKNKNKNKPDPLFPDFCHADVLVPEQQSALESEKLRWIHNRGKLNSFYTQITGIQVSLMTSLWHGFLDLRAY